MLTRWLRMLWPARPRRELDDWLPAVRASGRTALQETRDTRRERRKIVRKQNAMERLHREARHGHQ